MQYFEEEKNKIRAGFALNAGKLLVQYDEFCQAIPVEEQYDVTLTICVLHALSTNCWQLVNAMKNKNIEFKTLWGKSIPDVPFRMGLSKSFVTEDRFSSELTYGRFIEHIRNALSYPTYPEKRPEYASTGYTTRYGSSTTISHIIFVDLPWVSRGELLSCACNNKKETVDSTLHKHISRYGAMGLEVRENAKGEYQVFHKDKADPYFPKFEARFPLKELKILARELSNYIAQPARANWDGKSIERIVMS